MFKVGDILNYIPGGIEVVVVEVHDRHMLIRAIDDDYVLDPVYEDEYDEYELLDR